ncbi:DNA-binding response regulator [Paraburkholderia hospita]|uniref:DNA-binding response regulator n=2 Tax=Paraburkholderia hospita TaxID=169430 RepID=A0AAN1MR13_9BURK|nr:DNA-binding response regulator [Paraburkholderia hospita]OUL86643.1 hypothetical protein CA603_22135 [Paraburkholderia hospita]
MIERSQIFLSVQEFIMIEVGHYSTIERFIEETMSCFTRMTGAENLALYIRDVDSTFNLFERRGLPDAFHRLYLDEMYRYDPFDENMNEFPGADVALLSDYLTENVSHIEYRRFLSSFHISNIVELVFKSGPGLHAGMSVCLPKGCDASSAESIFNTARALHPYILFNLAALMGGGRRGGMNSLMARYGLSKREAQVAELVCKGFNNGDLATSLHISVATVKTHLLQIFGKTSVTNRTALVSLMLSQ